MRDHPAVALEITTDDSRVDPVSPAATRAFSYANTGRRTWSLFDCRRIARAGRTSFTNENDTSLQFCRDGSCFVFLSNVERA